MRIAIVGAGIAGLGSAWLLQKQGHAVTLFEADSYLGGHTHTVDVTFDGITAPVDTGFLVFNDRDTYPNLVALFDELSIQTVNSEMSFSVRIDTLGLEWAGTNLATLFVQPRNALRPAFWHMLSDIVRFNRTTTALIETLRVPSISLGAYLDAEAYGVPFRDWYLLPMAAAIWSSPAGEILGFPLPTFARFCHNHGLLQVVDRPQWRTVRGGGRAYVAKIAAKLADVRLATPVARIRRVPRGVEIDAAGRSERFDEVVLACHSVHTDTALLPKSPRAWSAWNYLAAADADDTRPVAVSYLINRVQTLPFKTPVIVTLNPPIEPDRAKVLREFDYSHPLLDGRALAAQVSFDYLQGQRHTWYAGAWLGHGFHEDGLKSAHAVATSIARRSAASVRKWATERIAA